LGDTVGGRAANNSLNDACTRPKVICNSFHGDVFAAVHRRTCAGACEFFLRYRVRVACTLKQVSWAPVHVQVCTLNSFLISMYKFANTLATGCAHALVYAQTIHWRKGTRVGGFS